MPSTADVPAPGEVRGMEGPEGDLAAIDLLAKLTRMAPEEVEAAKAKIRAKQNGEK